MRAKVDGEIVAEAEPDGGDAHAGQRREGRLTRCRGIHPTALVDPTAELAADVEVGAVFDRRPATCAIGAGTVIGPHVVVTGRTTLGARNRIFQFTSIGEIPQDRKYGGEPTTTTIGDDNVFREFVTDQRRHRAGPRRHARSATATCSSPTRTSRTTASSATARRSRTTRSSRATSTSATGSCMGAYSGVHQFCRVGAHAMIAAGAIVLQDVPPFVTAAGYPAKPHGTNTEGLRRRGFTADDILAVRRAYKTLYREGRALDDAQGGAGRGRRGGAGARAARRVPRRARARHRPLSASTATMGDAVARPAP